MKKIIRSTNDLLLAVLMGGLSIFLLLSKKIITGVENGLAAAIGLGKRTNNILQGAFFALTKVIPMDLAIEDMKKNNYNSYFKKAGQKIVDMNNQAVDLGVQASVKVEIPAAWADATDEPVAEPKNMTPFVRDIVMPLDKQQGDKLPVSVFQKYGVLTAWENGTSVYLKRGVATKVPKWNPDACIQCNRCSMLPARGNPSGPADRRGEGWCSGFLRYRSGKGPRLGTHRSTLRMQLAA